jgi:hypothetical protein
MNGRTRNPCSVNLRSAWEELRRVRAAVGDYFADSTAELRAAATLTAVELAVNVIEHGADSGIGTVTMAEENGDIVICSHSRVATVQKARAVRARIAGAAGEGARDLYMTRMLRLPRQRGGRGGGLGLLRITCEGAFQLRCDVLGGDRLHIQARRRFELAR